MADTTPKSYSLDPALYLYTSLTAGSSHIVTATSRMETILKANRIPFRMLDVATDEKARMLWGRRAGKDDSGRARKLPGLVQMGLVLGVYAPNYWAMKPLANVWQDIVDVEEWNEYGELKQHVKIVPESGTPAVSTAPTPSGTPSKPPKTDENKKPESSTSSENSKPPTGAQPTAFTLAMRQVGEEAAQKAKDAKNKVMEGFDGTGKGEDTIEAKQSAIVPPPTAVAEKRSETKIPIESAALLQSPTSTAWKNKPSTLAFTPSDVDPPVTKHGGSSVSVASIEEIQEIERSQAIAEDGEEDEEAIED
jgi:hypothetical protein